MMRTAGLVISIIAVLLALFCAYLSFQIGFSWAKFGEFAPVDQEAYEAQMAKPLETGDVFFLVPSALCTIGAGLGIAGSVLLRRKARLSGALFVASAVLCIFTIVGVISTVLFIVCGVLAFISAGRQPGIPQSANAHSRPAAVAVISVTTCTFAIIASLLALFLGLFQVSTYHPDKGLSDLYPSQLSMGVYLLICGILGTTGGILGIAGLSLGRKKRLRLGIAMVAAAVFCIPWFACVLTALLVLGSLYMLWPEKKQPQPAAEYPEIP